MVRLPRPAGQSKLCKSFPIRGYPSLELCIEAASEWLNNNGRIYWHTWPVITRGRVYVERRQEVSSGGEIRVRERAVACLKDDAGKWKKATFCAGGRRTLDEAIAEAKIAADSQPLISKQPGEET